MDINDDSAEGPWSDEDIEGYAGFISAFMDSLEEPFTLGEFNENPLFNAITQWEPERVIACQQAFFMINATMNPEAFGLG